MPDFPPNPLEKAGYVLEFHDEFDAPTINERKWIPYYLPQWSSRQQSQPRYRYDHDGFALTIEADQAPWCPEFDGDVKCSSLQTGVFSGAVGTSIGQHRFNRACLVREAQTTQRTYTPQYGYFEIRMKAIASPNCVCALWMIGFEESPEESGEIAIVEVFGNAVTPTHSEVRYGVHPFQDPTLTDEFYRQNLPMDATAFHLYAIEWTPTHIDFYVDNVRQRTLQQSPAYPMQFMLGVYELPDGGVKADNYPKRFTIDYFRGYRRVGGY